VASGRSAADYAESLLDLSPQGQLVLLPAVVGRKKGLQNRVRRIVKDKCGNPRIGLRWTLAVSLAAACITIGAAFAQTRPAGTEKVKKADTNEIKEPEDDVWRAAKQQLIAEQQQHIAEQRQLEQLQCEANAEENMELRKAYQDKLQTLSRQHGELRGVANLIKSKLKNAQPKQAEYEAFEAELRALGEQMKNIEHQLRYFDDARRRELAGWQDQMFAAQQDDLTQYRRDLQKLADKLQRELEETKDDKTEKVKIYDRMRATIEEIDKIQKQHSPPVPPMPVSKDQLLQDKERENFMLLKRELQAVRDRTRLRLEGLPKEADKLRDELKEIKAMIQSIDDRLHRPARQRQDLIDDFLIGQEDRDREMIAERLVFIAERQNLQLQAENIEHVLKKSPNRKDAEELKKELDKIHKRIREIDFELSSPEWCPEKRKATGLAKQQQTTNTSRLRKKQKSDSSCTSCHGDVDHIEVHRKEIEIPEIVIPEDEPYKTLPPVIPKEPGRPSPESAENLQHRVNQLQNEMTTLRSEIAAMRKLLKNLMEQEKRRSKQSNTVDIETLVERGKSISKQSNLVDTGTPVERKKSRFKKPDPDTENLVEDKKQQTDKIE
jgi:hypothetical protein